MARGVSEEKALPLVGSLMEGETRGGLAKRQLTFTFPRECPDGRNIVIICRYVGQRKSDPPDWRPGTNFKQLRRQANALQRMEDAYAKCCAGQNRWTRLPCALAGWMSSLDQYCDEEFLVITSWHECCKLWGTQRFDCFTQAAPSRSYIP